MNESTNLLKWIQILESANAAEKTKANFAHFPGDDKIADIADIAGKGHNNRAIKYTTVVYNSKTGNSLWIMDTFHDSVIFFLSCHLSFPHRIHDTPWKKKRVTFFFRRHFCSAMIFNEIHKCIRYKNDGMSRKGGLVLWWVIKSFESDSFRLCKSCVKEWIENQV